MSTKGLVNNLSDLVEDKLHVDENISIELSGLKFFCLYVTELHKFDDVKKNSLVRNYFQNVILGTNAKSLKVYGTTSLKLQH